MCHQVLPLLLNNRKLVQFIFVAIFSFASRRSLLWSAAKPFLAGCAICRVAFGHEFAATTANRIHWYRQFGIGTPHSQLSFGSQKTILPIAQLIKQSHHIHVHSLQNPAVSWQPSADQRRLIGHIVLYKPSALASVVPNSLSTSAGFSPSLDFGVKVVGGRNPSTGRFGAFVSRIRPGSVADTVGQLRAGLRAFIYFLLSQLFILFPFLNKQTTNTHTGDEVLEWNGHSLQNITPEVCKYHRQCKHAFPLTLSLINNFAA